MEIKDGSLVRASLPGVLKLEEVACALRVSARHIRRKVREGKFPQPIMIGKALRFNETDILDLIQGRNK